MLQCITSHSLDVLLLKPGARPSIAPDDIYVALLFAGDYRSKRTGNWSILWRQSCAAGVSGRWEEKSGLSARGMEKGEIGGRGSDKWVDG